MKTASEYVTYNGERFYLQTSGRYYLSGKKTAEVRILHRRIWSDVNGPIPDGMIVHHKDGDWRNNDISNLELMPPVNHNAMHMRERWCDDDQKSAFLSGLEKAREAAKAWHASPEGLLWHSENGKKAFAARKQEEAVCLACSGVFLTYWKTKAKFCSKSCQNKTLYQAHKTSSRNCDMCGSEFVANKYKKTAYCSRTCSNRHRSVKVRLECAEA